MRILHICGATSGAPWLCEIVREQLARQHEVAVVIAGGDGPLAAALDNIGARYLVLPHDPFANADPWGAWRRISRLAALIGQERPDVTHSHLFPSNIAGRIAAWLADVPIRLSMNPGPYFLESPIFSQIDVSTAWADTRVIASCEYVRALYADNGIGHDRTTLIYYGSNTSRFDPARADVAGARQSLSVSSDTPLVGMVAYFYPASPDSPMTPPRLVGRGLKGHDVLLRAVPRVLAHVPNTKFALVGDGWGDRGREYLREMQALAAELGVADAVIFAGNRTDIPDLLASFDVALQCSLSENVGGAIEALLMAAPMVVARTGGLIDAVRHDETGLVVPPDDPDALAGAIVEMLTDRTRARRFGEQGRALMLSRFTATRTADDMDALYRACADEGGFGARAPRDAGYRWSRRVWRQLTAPIWMLRLARPTLLGIAGDASLSTPALTWFMVRLLAARFRDVSVAAVILIVATPLFVLHRMRHLHAPLFSDRVVTGRHGLPFSLCTFTVEPSRWWMRRLPWFVTLLKTRRLVLFGPEPVPYGTTQTVARTDPRAQQRPGIFTLRRERRAHAPELRSPQPPPARRS